MNLQNSLLWTEYRINRFHWECASEKRQLKKIEWKFVVAVCKFAERPEGITKNSSFPFVVYWFIFHFFCSLLSWRLLYTYIFYQFEHYFFFCLPVLKFFSPSLKPNIFHSKSFALVTSGDFRSDLCACAELLHRPSEACGSVRCVCSIPSYFFFLLFVIAGTLKFALVDTLCHALSATSVYRGRFKQINDKNTKLCALEIDIDILYYFFFHFSLISLQDTK